MTPEDKSALNARIAAGLKALGLEALAYEAAETCPQGHNSTVATEHPDYDDHDDWVPDDGWRLGSLCLNCIADSPLVKRTVPDDWAYYAYDKARRIRVAYDGDRNFHPEWRIGVVPRDFSEPRYFDLAVRAFCDVKRWSFHNDYYPVSPSQPGGYWEAYFKAKLSGPELYLVFDGSPDVPLRSLAAALADDGKETL